MVIYIQLYIFKCVFKFIVNNTINILVNNIKKVFKIWNLFIIMGKKRIRKEHVVTYLFMFVLIGIAFGGLYFLDVSMTGFAVYEQSSQSEFNLGIYNRTGYNGSAVVLSEDNLTGTYTSKVFDAGGEADWNKLIWEGETSIDSDSFLTSAIHGGDNVTELFVLDDIYYLADMKDSSKNIYFNFSNNLINNSVLKIYAKIGNGVTIGIYAFSDTLGENPLGVFTVDSDSGEWYNVILNIETPTNSIWIGEGTGSGTDPKDYFDYIYAEIPGTNLSFQIKNCSSSDCSDGTWQDADLANLNLQSRYFQYKLIFSSPDSSITPELQSINIDYDLLDSFPPQISFLSSTTATGEYNQDNIFVDVEVADESQIYSFINFDDSLVGFWKMNDTGNVAKDYSGYGNDGTINDSSSTTGKFGDALSFDGTEVIEIQHHASISINTPYSISAWIKPSDVSGMNIITSKDEAVWEMMMMVSNGELYVGFENCADDNFLGLGGTITVDNWQHIIYIYNGSRVLGYINGVEVVNVDGSGTPCVSGYSLGIGDSKHGISYPFNGVIDEVLIFNRVLSSAEISALYSSSSYANNFTSLEDGSYEFYSYTQDTSGNENQTEIRTVNLVSNVAPLITLVEPQNILYVTNESLVLNFIASDSDGNLDSCWYNLDNEENITLENCTNTTFNVPMDGTYAINLFANDSEGLEESDSVNFNVDVTGVSVALSEPSGTKSSRVNIPLIFTATGNNLICWYNIKTSIGGNIIENTILENCSSSSFDVSADGDYVLNLYANNTLGSSDFDSSGFSVDTSSGDTVVVSSGGGGGGGSSKTIIQTQDGTIELIVGEISDLIVNLKDIKKISWSVKNTGTNFLNDCKVKGEGGYASWIFSEEVKNLAAGEEQDFIFNLNIPEIIEAGKYDLIVSLVCQEVSEFSNFVVEIIEKKLGFELVEVERNIENQVKIIYLLEELSGLEQEVEIQFLLFDFNDEKVAEVKEIKKVPANSKQEFEILIPIDSSLEGELNLLVNLNSETYSTFFQENIILGSSISGFLIFGEADSDDVFSGAFIILFLVFAFFMVRRILKHRKKKRK